MPALVRRAFQGAFRALETTRQPGKERHEAPVGERVAARVEKERCVFRAAGVVNVLVESGDRLWVERDRPLARVGPRRLKPHREPAFAEIDRTSSRGSFEDPHQEARIVASAVHSVAGLCGPLRPVLR